VSSGNEAAGAVHHHDLLVERFVSYLRAVDCSPNTIAAYRSHLGLLFRWLASRRMPLEALTFDGLCAFVLDLQDGAVRAISHQGSLRPQRPRTRSTVEAHLAAVHSFLDFCRMEGAGPKDLVLYRERATASSRSRRSFLAHVEVRRAGQERRIKVRGPKPQEPKIIGFESDFQALIDAARTARDRLLVAALYDGGLRIGQALGLRHADIDIARRRVSIVRRMDNANGALSRQRSSFYVDLPDRFFDLYGECLVVEQLENEIDSEYVFVNLQGPYIGRPMTYSNAAKVVRAMGERVGLRVTPHMLRHTHGTALARLNWSAPQIAKRLGQSAATSADVYIHLVEEDITAKYRETVDVRQR
jgi:integrase/recombinase XerD